VTQKIGGFSASDPVATLKGSRSGAVSQKDGEAAGGTNVATTQTGDQVTLTNSARSLQKLEEAVSNAPVVDSAKVASVKQSVESGTYQVNPSNVADKMIKFERGLK
jgi:negative regulator of flagellin synthesis FlgM